MKTILLFLFGSCFFFSVTAQQVQISNEIRDSLYDAKFKKPHVTTGIKFMSNEVYNGQQIDSFPQSGLHSQLSFFLGKGWSLNYLGSYWFRNQPHYALTTIGVNKEMTIGKKMNLSLDYNRWILHDAVRQDAKQFTQNVEMDAGYELGNFYAGFYSMFLFGQSFSSFSSPSLNYTKRTWLGSNKSLGYSFTVSALANIGNYDASYIPFQRTVKTLQKKKKKPGAIVSTTEIVSPKTFGLLNQELQIEQELDMNNNSINFIITHSVPSALLRNNNIKQLTFFSLEYRYNIFHTKSANKETKLF